MIEAWGYLGLFGAAHLDSAVCQRLKAQTLVELAVALDQPVAEALLLMSVTCTFSISPWKDLSLQLQMPGAMQTKQSSCMTVKLR